VPRRFAATRTRYRSRCNARVPDVTQNQRSVDVIRQQILHANQITRWTSHRISEASTSIVDRQHPRHSPHRYRAQRCAAVWFAEPRSIGPHHTAPRSIDMNHAVLRSLVSAEPATAARKSASSLAVQPLHHAVLRRLVSAEPASAARKSASSLAVQPLSSASVPALGHINATC